MFTQANTTELSVAGAAVADRELDLAIAMIEGASAHMPYAAVGAAINPIHSQVVHMPYAAVGAAINPIRSQVVHMPYAAGRSNLRATKTVIDAG